MTNPFQLATREAVRARIALTGPPGSGKTFTALTLATTLAKKVAVIDTEHGRAKEHAGVFTFDHMAPATYDPRELVKLIAAAAHNGYDGLVVDSWSHYWMGTGGALEIVDRAKSGGLGGWKEYRPMERAVLDAFLSYPGHLIVTMRVKVAYVVEPDERGKQVPRKVGLKPDQRDGAEYEFSIVGEIDLDHTMTVTKTTCPDLVDAVIPKPGPEVAEAIRKWIDSGEKLPDAREMRDEICDPSTGVARLKAIWQDAKRRGLLGAPVVNEVGDDDVLGALIERLAIERKSAAVPVEEGITDA